jgi:hypothetical protein
MLAAIHFEDEPPFPANKVDDVRADWLLANKFEPG